MDEEENIQEADLPIVVEEPYSEEKERCFFVVLITENYIILKTEEDYNIRIPSHMFLFNNIPLESIRTKQKFFKKGNAIWI